MHNRNGGVGLKDTGNDKELDLLITRLAKQVGDEEVGRFITNHDRVRLVEMSAVALKDAVSGGKISYELHEPFETFGSITITGENIEIINPELFVSLATAADNIEACPKLDGTIDINFAYTGLSRKVR